MAGGDDEKRRATKVGRYVLLDEIARGGMATVNLGRLLGGAGFSRTVAIKRLHPHLGHDDEFAAMLVDEARLVSRIQHPNVVSMLDVVSDGGEAALVMDYVAGETLSAILKAERKRGARIPLAIGAAIVVDVLRGLDAAHEAKSARAEPLGLIHRDVTPHNIMVRTDGTSVIVDFGVAKAAGRLHTTEEGKVKGKLPYMAPEQVRSKPLSRRVDVYAAGAVLWEVLVGRRFVGGESEAQVLERLLYADYVAPSAAEPGVPSELDAVVLRALATDPDERFATAGEMAAAIEACVAPARPSQVASWLEEVVGPALAKRAARVAALEAEDADLDPLPPPSTGSLDATVSDKASARTPTHQDGASAGTSFAERPSRIGTIALALALIAALPIAWFAARAAFASDPEPKPAPPLASVDLSKPTAVTSTPSPSVTAAATATATATASATAPDVGTAEPTTKTPARAVRAQPRAAPKAKKRRCAEVTIDAAGQKHFHPECMDDG